MSDPRHWLYRPQNLPRLWRWGGALLALSVVAEFFVDLHAKFGFADWFAFNALFGFAGCLLMVVFAKWLGGWVKRPEDYYQADDDDESGPGRSAADVAAGTDPETQGGRQGTSA